MHIGEHTIGEHNLATLAEDAETRLGDHRSMFFEGTWYGSGELLDRARRAASGLGELGVRPGERVVVFMANTPEVGIAYNAIWRAGAVCTPAIFLLPPAELRHVLTDSEAAAVITTPELLATVRAAADGVDTLRHVVCVGGGEATTDFAELEASEPGDIVPRADDDLAALLYTGGTTGRSKGVMLSHTNYWHSARSATDASYVPDLPRVILPLPLSHAYGLGVTIMAGHQPEPSESVLMRWFDPTGFLQLVADHGIHRAAVVPSMLQMLLAAPLEDYDLSSLRLVSSGAAPLPLEVVEAFERRVPNATIIEGYGCTESASFVSMNRPDARKVGTVGPPMPGIEVRIVDESDTPLPAGTPGEVMVRSQGVMQGYWHAREATAQTLRGGWLATGDIGMLDEDGFLTILDRKKDLIIRGGFNVYPSDVEDALVEHPEVEMAAVVGAPDDKHGEEVVAFVQLAADATVTGEELVAWSKERLGGYKYPRIVHVIDQVPLTPVMKIDRKALRARLATPAHQVG